MDDWDADLRAAVHAMIPQVEGRPCVILDLYYDRVHVVRRITGLDTEQDCFVGFCEWANPEEARSDSLTAEMAISCDCVRLGPGWWQDLYFSWYTVFDLPLVERSLAGDHSWVPAFLDSVQPKAEPGDSQDSARDRDPDDG